MYLYIYIYIYSSPNFPNFIHPKIYIFKQINGVFSFWKIKVNFFTIAITQFVWNSNYVKTRPSYHSLEILNSIRLLNRS